MKKEKNFNKGEVIIYKAKDGPKLDVRLNMDTVWLTQSQIAVLFSTQRPAITKHVKKIFQTGELKKNSVSSILEHTAADGKKYKTLFYNLDAVIAIGYRVNSKRATHFRIWATKTLKDHLIRGYTINEKRLLQTKESLKKLQETISFLQKNSKNELLDGQAQEILNLLSIYSSSLQLLEQYDKGTVVKRQKEKAKFILRFEECQEVVTKIKKELVLRREASDFFGRENSDRLAGIIKGIYQTFDGKELYKSLEEKAAHILYLIIKDHPFVDGNKRIASFLFIYYLDKNNYLYKKTGEKKINDNALTALALLIAVSDPKEKEIMINITTNLIS